MKPAAWENNAYCIYMMGILGALNGNEDLDCVHMEGWGMSGCTSARTKQKGIH